jgi:histidyl-tRNA synthetase
MERLPGFRDFYPEPLPHPDEWSADVRRYIFDQWREVCRRYGFREYDGPPLEPLELFTTKSGAEIIGQLYNFTDKGDRSVALRPEMTPTLARMVAASERSYKKPIKWFAIPQLFRYERQQKGRLREHFQFNADIFGESDPSADAELIALLIDTLRSFGLTPQDFVIRLSSRNAWQDFFRQRCSDASREYDFYQVIDKMEREDPAVTKEKLAAMSIAASDVETFVGEAQPTEELGKILESLSARGLREFVKIDYNVIRGLAYYTGPVFEAFDCKGEFRAIAGGGRYDHLVKLISGGKVNLAGLGFGMGDVVLTELLKARGLLPKPESAIKAFCLIEDESLRAPSLGLVQELREQRFAIEYSLTPAKSDKQFKRAVELNAAYTIKLERTDSGEIHLRFKNLKTRVEQLVPPSEAATHLRTEI